MRDEGYASLRNTSVRIAADLEQWREEHSGAALAELRSLFQTARILAPRSRAAFRHDLGIAAEAGWDGIPPSVAAQLLASAIDAQFGEAVTVMEKCGDGRVRVTRHSDRACRQWTESAGSPHPRDREPRERSASLAHWIHVEDTTGACVFPTATARLDRIVSMVGRVELPAVASLAARCLKAGARDARDESSPRFSSFVPTFLGDRSDSGSSRARTIAEWRPAGFDRLVDEPSQRPRGWRLLRDACWLELDQAAVVRAWQQWMRRGCAVSLDSLLDGQDRAALARWARAVTNRQVGLALSGGGASSYRFVPALRRFAEPEGHGDTPSLPIDVVSGVSGGALLGAYYSAEDIRGLDRAIADGRDFQIALPAFAAWSRSLEWLLDSKLGRRSIASLPRRFVPVAVCLVQSGAPETRVLLDMTIGEAVRASGSLPLFFGPSSIRGERYSDGAFGSMIPTRAVAMHGADMIVAINCIAGPARGMPTRTSDLARSLERWTPAGRFVDLWISIAYLQQETGRLAARTGAAACLVEPTTSEAPFLEMIRFASASDIASDAARDEPFVRGVEAAIARWRSFRDFGAASRHQPRALHEWRTA